jgi:nicotinate phosphoribosyltransferase
MSKPIQLVTPSDAAYVRERTDKYFSKSRAVVERFGDKAVTYGVFMRRRVICAIDPALELLRAHYPGNATTPLVIKRLYEEGAVVPDQKPLFVYSGSLAALLELETLVLQRIGIACISAYNAYKMALNLPKVAFIDMHARHASGDDMTRLAAYGAALGSRMAKLNGATGFVGTSLDLTAPYYGEKNGVGTMPHALIGYAGSTLRAAQMFMQTHPEDDLTVLVDYYGREYSDAIEVCRWWYGEYLPESVAARAGKRLSLRIDTHGDRFAEGLSYESSVQIVTGWLHVDNEYDVVRMVMGEEAFDADTMNVVKDRVRRVLFGTGVSVASVIRMRQALDAAGYKNARIVGSSGFNLFKCKMFGNARAPLDAVGTGSFIPEAYGETYATADIFMYDGKFDIKLGRERIFQNVKS